MSDDVGAISHDLRECVAGIRALAQQLRVTERLWASPDGPQYLEVIERASGDALEMLSRLEPSQECGAR